MRRILIVAAMLFADVVVEFEAVSPLRDRACSDRLPPVEKLNEVRGVIAAAKYGERCAIITRSEDSDRASVLERIVDLAAKGDSQ